MSTFVIFVIVLTLGYMLYYAAMITIDLTAKQKSESATEETIDTEGMSDADDDFTPRNVTENIETGGFSFSSPRPVASVTDTETEIAEAEEEVEDVPEETDGESVSNTPESSSEEDGEQPSSEDMDLESKTDETSSDDCPSGEQAAQEDAQYNEHTESSDTVEQNEDTMPGIEHYEEQAAEEPVHEDFDVNDAFDPDLMTPKYGVTEVLEPPVSEETQEKADMVNASLLSIETKGNQFSSFDINRIMHENRAEQYNVETHDEVTNY